MQTFRLRQATLRHLKHSHQSAFSLIELLVAIAIIGVLSAIALPAYQNYVRNANMTRVNTHMQEGTRFAENELRRLQANLSMGLLDPAGLDALLTADQLTARLSASGGTAPSGAAAYRASAHEAADDTSGQIAIEVTGTIVDADYSVEFTRPAFADFAATQSEVIRWTDM